MFELILDVIVLFPKTVSLIIATCIIVRTYRKRTTNADIQRVLIPRQQLQVVLALALVLPVTIFSAVRLFTKLSIMIAHQTMRSRASNTIHYTTLNFTIKLKLENHEANIDIIASNTAGPQIDIRTESQVKTETEVDRVVGIYSEPHIKTEPETEDGLLAAGSGDGTLLSRLVGIVF